MKTRCLRSLLSVSAIALAVLLTTSLQAGVIVDDSWSDGDLAKTGALDSNWWTSSSTSGIEVSVGSMGLVTGTSGRGVHTIFPTQTLEVGDSLCVSYDFTTPATLGSGSTAFRVGLFDTLGRAGLDANVNASSGSPNELYGYVLAVPETAALPGYMFDMDVNNGATSDLNFREHTVVSSFPTTPTGRLMATTTGFANISPSGPDEGDYWTASTAYSGTFVVKRISLTEMKLTGTIAGKTYTVTDEFDSNEFGMLGFHANSNIFGSTSTQDVPDNGIDFSNIRIEYKQVPEPSALALLLMGLISLSGLVRRK